MPSSARSRLQQLKRTKLVTYLIAAALTLTMSGLYLRAQWRDPVILPQIPLPGDDTLSNVYRNSQYGFELSYPSSWDIYYEATEQDISDMLATNLQYDLSRPIKLAGLEVTSLEAGYPEEGEIAISLDLRPLQSILDELTLHRIYSHNSRIINNRLVVETETTFVDEGTSFSFENCFFLSRPEDASITIRICGLGYASNRNSLESLLHQMLETLTFSK